MATESEELFEQFCKSNGWFYSRLAERGDQGLQTPDYLLFPHSKKPIVIEIKQLDANDQDVENDKSLRDGEPITQTWSVGQRVRTKLSSSTIRQLAGVSSIASG